MQTRIRIIRISLGVICISLLAMVLYACAGMGGRFEKTSSARAPGGEQMARGLAVEEDFEGMPGLSEDEKGVSWIDQDAYAEPPAPGTSPTDSSADGDATPAAVHGAPNIESWIIPAAYAAETSPDERYLIRSGSLTCQVDDYDVAADQVAEVARKYDGVVTDSSMSKYGDGTRSGWVKIRVPNENFFDAWEDLRQIGEVADESTSSEDVSAQYLSAYSRLKVLVKEQETLEAMLEEAREVQKTRGLGEAYDVLLKTQERLSEVNYDIQSTEDRLRGLADRIERSTITVNLSERPVYEPEEFVWGLGSTFNEAWKDLLLGIRNGVRWLIRFLITSPLWLVPLAIIVLIIWAIIRLATRRQRRKKPTAPTPPANPPSAASSTED